MELRMVSVWDPVVRSLHWGLVAAVAIALATGDEMSLLHRWAGYVVLALVGLRSLWGLIGPRYARFTQFIHPPAAVMLHVREAIAGTARRHLGHNPAGGAMAAALMTTLLVLVSTGILAESSGFMAHIAEEIHEGLGGLVMLLIGLHLAGVALTSVQQRENLAKAMIDGRKLGLKGPKTEGNGGR